MINLSKLTQNKIGLIILSIFIVLFFVRYYSIRVPKNVKVQVNHDVVCGQIIKYIHSYKFSEMTFKFQYQAKQFTFNMTPTASVIKKYSENKGNILIVVEKDNPLNWRILGEWDNFTFYNIERKDTVGLPCDFY